MQVGDIVRFRSLPGGGVEYDPDGELYYRVTEIVHGDGYDCIRCTSDEGISPVWVRIDNP
jgi:hypothetical protein